MRSLWLSANRWLTWFHRWAGVVLCLLFAAWFASGAVLHFVAFPALSRADKLAGSEPIDLSRLSVDASTALGRVPQATDLRLLSVAGQPVYVVRQAEGTWVSVAGDTGAVLSPFSARTASSVAERFSRVAAADVSAAIDYDQWIVHQRFDPFRPFYRVQLNDSAGTDLYVSARTGEVLQCTRFAERAWNWSGAVMHWIYFTPLRKSYRAWNQVVWWISLIALLSSSVGTWLGLVRLAGNRAAGRKGISPFRGWMRWHHIIGLFASIIVVTWMLSGWLSMDHGRLFSRSEATPREALQMSGLSLDDIAKAATLESIRAVGPASEITFNAVAGRVFLSAYGPSGQDPRILFLDEWPRRMTASLPEALLVSGVTRAWPGKVRATPIDAYDGLYRLAESATGSVAIFAVAQNSALRIYVDRLSGRFVAIMNPSRRSYAWIYYALHTFQFPGLIEHPAIRTIVVLVLLTLGFMASITGMVLSVKRLRREFA
ncbi:MAG: PepSY-associated helix domain protein [Gammaproteobacteria bacterium]|nr:PepSY-associated helix domain protein [Gammaproteobacteria bacterium]